MRQAVIHVITAGCLLHLYTITFKAAGGWSPSKLGLFVFSLTPYIAPAILAARNSAKAAALGLAVGALLGDLYIHYTVFIAPTSSTAALGLLFMPVWNLIVLGPACAFVAWLASAAWDRYARHDAQ